LSDTSAATRFFTRWRAVFEESATSTVSSPATVPTIPSSSSASSARATALALAAQPAASVRLTKQLMKKNLAAAKAFLAENGAKEGVKTLPSGLQYKVLTDGTGPKPAATDTVTVHYRGKLIDGTEFDSSYKRNEPAVFPLNGVIPCWTEALQLMQVGGTAEIYCPAAIAYGDSGQGPMIHPGAALRFEVELLSIE